jgi:hypothetical protein
VPVEYENNYITIYKLKGWCIVYGRRMLTRSLRNSRVFAYSVSNILDQSQLQSIISKY